MRQLIPAVKTLSENVGLQHNASEYINKQVVTLAIQRDLDDAREPVTKVTVEEACNTYGTRIILYIYCLQCNVTLVYTAATPNIIQCNTSNFGVLSILPVYNINFVMICEPLWCMLKEPAAPHLLGFTFQCKRGLWVKAFLVTLVCTPWLIRTMGQTLLLHFYHDKVLTHILVTQTISRERVGWIPCYMDLTDLADVDNGSCICSTLRRLWTLADRREYFDKYLRPTIVQSPRHCTCNVDTVIDEQVTLDYIRYLGWILQGYCATLQ